MDETKKADVASTLFEIKHIDEHKGRGLVATCKISKDQVVFREYPFAYSVPTNVREKVCNYSLGPPENGSTLKRCTRTRSAFFKGKPELEKAWKENGYKEECKALVRLRKHRPDGEIPENVLFAARVCWKMNSRCSSEQDRKMIENLSCMWDKEPPNRKSEHKNLAVLLAILVDGIVESEEHVLKYAKLISKLNTNSFSICGPESNMVAHGIFPQYAALINHSMTPNCVPAFALGDRGKMSLIAVREIAEGEEITISYTPFEDSYMQKLSRLRSNYYFDYNGLRADRQEICSFVTEQPVFKIKLIKVKKLEKDDPGLDVQMVQNENNGGIIEFYVRDMQTCFPSGKIEQAVEANWLAHMRKLVPIPSLARDHPINIQILRTKADEQFSFETNLEYVKALECSKKFLDSSLLWASKITLLFEYTNLFDMEAIMKMSREILAHHEHYLQCCGINGKEIVNSLHVLAQNPSFYLQNQRPH